MTKKLLLSLAAAACLTSACAHAQQPENAGGRRVESTVVEIPQPPATAYLGFESELRRPVPGKPVVVSVERRSPAATAGLQVGDALELLDGRNIVEARINLRQLTPGREYRLTISRGGETRVLLLVPAPPRPEN